MSFGSDAAGRASLRLAALFTLIVVLLLATSTVLLYVSVTRETHDVLDRSVLDESTEREMVAQAIARLRWRFILIDAAVFAVVGVAGFWYARRTMRPIDNALSNQRRFIANASHELRTPLAIMKADYEVAQRGPPDVAELQRALDSGLEEVERMSGVVADLLTLSRIDAHEEPLERRQVDLCALLDATVSKLEALAALRGVDVVREGGHGELLAAVDPERLQRALFNLVKNAVEHSPPGSRVAVRAACDGERVRVQVADHGAGMTPEQLRHVFERFYRADDARGRASGGSGLGLPIALWIVEAHGGTLHLMSTRGVGTTATVLLPLAPQRS
jgi:two-component system sensor histidine kinase CiaH